jgi:hypothetical protein
MIGLLLMTETKNPDALPHAGDSGRLVGGKDMPHHRCNGTARRLFRAVAEFITPPPHPRQYGALTHGSDRLGLPELRPSRLASRRTTCRSGCYFVRRVQSHHLP